jgi:hypothetical protein
MNYSKIVMLTITFFLLNNLRSNAQPGIEESAKEPVKYVGSEQTDKHYHHGGLRHAVGVHRYQIFRANRTQAPEGGMVGWTYSHAPMLAYWNKTFYLQYLSNLKEEHNPPSRTLIITSKDGRTWSIPEVVFPVYSLPEIIDGDNIIQEGTPSVMHQRMGFYVAPNGKLLTIGFYSYCVTPRDGPNTGKGLGRVVREIYKDGAFGPIYFIRYNRHAGWNENNTPHYPFYKTSKDNDFIEACDALLKDKLMTLQWWEMDQAKDGFYTLEPGENQIKAFSYYRRPDNVVVGLWKYNLTSLSADNGLSWTPLVTSPSLKTCAAKLWGQQTDDGRYAIVYNHSASYRNRFPMVVITGDDGQQFDHMLCLHGEVPPMRYQGIHKNVGSQYVRGIVEGNGNPPGDHLWNTYSMNKEDIWVSRCRIPVAGSVKEHVQQDFEQVIKESELELWNFHIPKWAPISVEITSSESVNRYLQLLDEEPYDYALAERTFPESKEFRVNFRIMQKQVGHSLLEFEIHDRYGKRPLRLRFDPDWLSFDRGKGEPRPVPFSTGKWYDIELILSCKNQNYNVKVNRVLVKDNLAFAEKVETLERLVFRTGPWRSDVRMFILDGEPGNPGLYQEDLPGADHKVAKSVFLIDDVRTSPQSHLLKGEGR